MSDPANQQTAIDPLLAELLRCPACGATVSCGTDVVRCASAACGLIYPVVDGMPVMLVESARRPT